MLPSRFQIGNDVVVNFGLAGVISGRIGAVTFREGQVNYDIVVYPFPDEQGPRTFVVLPNVRSYYVEEAMDRFRAVPPENTNGFNGASNVGLILSEN